MTVFKYTKSKCKRGVPLFLCILIVLTSCIAPLPKEILPQQFPGISDGELNNLIVFARLVGYVQYFHPSDQANSTNWEEFTERGLIEARSAENSTDLASRLNSLFQPIAPTVRIFETEKQSQFKADEMIPPTAKQPLRVVAWRHHGFGGGVKQDLYYSERVYQPVRQGAMPAGMPDPHKPFYADLGGGVSALIPLALYADDAGTLPHSAEPVGTVKTIPTLPANEKTMHLATVILAWNVFEHFYPYFDVVKTDWPGVLRTALAAADSAENEEQFVNVLREMVAQLHDGHGQVIRYAASELYRPPFGWDWVDDQLVITFVEDQARGQLHPGDRVTAIDGEPIDTVLASQERLISGATPQWIRFSAIKNLLEGPQDSIMTLTLQPFSGPSHDATFKRQVFLSYSGEYLFTEQRPPAIHELQPGIWYVDLTRTNDDQFNNAIPDLATADGIVFDMRGYPFDVGLDAISHIIDSSVPWPQLNIPVITYPDHQNISYEASYQTVEPLVPKFNGKVAFITDGRAISYAESYLGIIEANKIADIVGQPTAGTNGNIVAFTLLGRYTFVFTGMQVLKLDGSQHHGIGIQPTIFAARTLEGVREGRDELLESAIRIITRQ